MRVKDAQACRDGHPQTYTISTLRPSLAGAVLYRLLPGGFSRTDGMPSPRRIGIGISRSWQKANAGKLQEGSRQSGPLRPPRDYARCFPRTTSSPGCVMRALPSSHDIDEDEDRSTWQRRPRRRTVAASKAHSGLAFKVGDSDYACLCWSRRQRKALVSICCSNALSFFVSFDAISGALDSRH